MAKELSDKDKLNLALELMSDRDVEYFHKVAKFVEENDLDIYEALEACHIES